MSKQYYMYLRKSRADLEAEARGEGETLARHRRALTALAQRNGHPISRIFEEIVSGDTIASRPEMQSLLAIVESGACAGVYVNDVDRLARGDSIDQGIVKQAFYATNTLIITPYKVYDPTNVADEDFFDFSLFMARFEYKVMKRRMQTGRMRSASEGNYLGTRPVYGYERVKRPDRPGCTLQPVPEKAEIVRSIFNWYAYGDGSGKPLSADAIAKRLNAMGLRTDLGVLYDGNRIRAMLRNPAYIGRVSWAKHVKKVKLVDGVRTELREKNPAPIIVDNAHPAIIDIDLWNKVQTMFATHAKLPKNTDAPVRNVLAGLFRCVHCGRTLLRKESNGRPDMLACKTYGCPTTGIYIPIAERAVIEALEDWNARYSLPPEPASEPAEASAPTLAIERQLSTLEKQLERLHDLVEQGVYTPADFVRRRDALRDRMQSLQSQLASMQTQPTTEDLIRAELPQIRHVLESYPTTQDLQERNNLLRTVIDHVDYDKTHRCFRNENPADFLTLTFHPKLQK